MPTYNQIYDAHKASAYAAYGGNQKRPNMSPAYATSLHASWKAMYKTVWRSLGGKDFLTGGLGALVWDNEQSTALRPLEQAWNHFDGVVSESIDAVGSNGLLLHPEAVWGELGPLANIMTTAPNQPTFGQDANSWLENFLKPIREVGSDALDWIKIAVAIGAGLGAYLLYKELSK